MSDVAQICQNYGVKTNPSISKDQGTVDILTALGMLLDAKKVVKDTETQINALVGKLSPATQTEVGRVFNDKRYATLRFSDRFQAVIDAIASSQDKTVLGRMKWIAKIAEGKVDRVLKKLSTILDRKTYNIINSKPDEPSKIKIATAMLLKRISPALQARVKSVKTSKDVLKLIKVVCLKHKWVKPRVVKPKNGQKPKVTPPWYSRYSFNTTIGVGYSDNVVSPDNPATAAGFPRGIVPFGRLNFNANVYKTKQLELDVQANYFSTAPIALPSDVLFNHDIGTLSFIFNAPKAKVKGEVRIGWQYTRFDYPSVQNMDVNGLVQGMRVIYEAIDNLNIFLDQSLRAGFSRVSLDEEADSFGLIDVRAMLGASYKVGLATPFAGALFENRGKDVSGGGFLGALVEKSGHQAAARAQYAYGTQSKSLLDILLKYSYSGKDWKGWSVGVGLNYNDDFATQRSVGGQLFGQVKVASFWDHDLLLQPYVDVTATLNSADPSVRENVINIGGGIIIRLVGKRFVLPSLLTPHRLKPLNGEW